MFIYKHTVHAAPEVIWNWVITGLLRGFSQIRKGKGKGHRCTGTEALYRPYGP